MSSIVITLAKNGYIIDFNHKNPEANNIIETIQQVNSEMSTTDPILQEIKNNAKKSEFNITENRGSSTFVFRTFPEVLNFLNEYVTE